MTIIKNDNYTISRSALRTRSLLNMSTSEAQPGPLPKGTAKGEFFYREENPFRGLDKKQQPTVTEAEEEFETNDVQFKALKQDVLLKMFEPGLESDGAFPASGNIFDVGNRTGYFVCGRQNGLVFGKTELLRAAFEEAKPKTTASLKGAFTIELPETPTHVRFTGDEQFVVIVMPNRGGLVLMATQLQQKKPLDESMKCKFQAASILDILPNPSYQHSNQIAYIVRTFAGSPYGKLYLFDISAEKSNVLDPQREYTCMTFSHDGDILMACTKSGEALYYNSTNSSKPPIRRPPPTELPELEDSWWIVQGVHWIDTWNQLLIYNPLSHPSDPPVHEYQAYVISNPSRLPTIASLSFEFIKLPVPPVDAFGNNELYPWFWFQTLRSWKPGVRDLVLCSVTAGSDIGLLGRDIQPDLTNQWRLWTISDENRRATVPYNMEKNEETIVAGMQLDFTPTKKLEKPLYPDEDPPECDALPILWVLNTSGQLAGWTVIYVPGIKARERPIAMMPVEWQDKYWKKEQETREKRAENLDEEEKRDMTLWEEAWREKSSNETTATSTETTVNKATSVEAPSLPTPSAMQTPVQVPTNPTPVTQSPSTISLLPSISAKQPSKPAFGKPSPLGASTFGQTGQLGGLPPGQTGMYSSSSSAGFGGMSSSGFAKYSSSQSGQGGGFLSGPTSQSGSFLGSKGGSFLDGGQKSSFLKADQDHGFGKYASGDGFGTPRSATTSSAFSDGGFLASRPAASSQSPFGALPKGSLGQRTQPLGDAGNRIQAIDDDDDDSSEKTRSDESDTDESASEEDVNVNVDAAEFGDSGFSLNLGGKTIQQETEIKQFFTPVKNSLPEGDLVVSSSDTQSPSSITDTKYVKASIPITPSPQPDKSKPVSERIKDLTPSARDKPPKTEESPGPRFPGFQNQKFPNIPTSIAQVTPAKPVSRTTEPPNPFAAQIPLNKQEIERSPFSLPAAGKVSSSISPATIATSKNKVEPRQYIPASGAPGISSRLSDSSNISDAFRMVIEQVSRELGKLSENANNFAKHVIYESRQKDPKTVSDLGSREEWSLADLYSISRIVDVTTKSLEETGKKLPSIDESIQDLEKSLKKMEAKKMELDRFVQAVRDPEVRESIYSRKLAPDFARQQKEIRHALQIAEEKLRDLTSALTVLKADLADEKGSFGVHSPSTAGIYRVINNTFSRLQLLTAKVISLEKRLQSVRGMRQSSPPAESSAAGSSVQLTNPVGRVSTSVTRSSPSRSPVIRTPIMSPTSNVRESPLRRTMLDEKLDPWEAEEIIREMLRKEEFRKKIGRLLRGTRPLSSEVNA